MADKKKMTKKSFAPVAGKMWIDKVNNGKSHEIKKNEKGFADIPPGSTMLIATPKIIDDYVRQIPKGTEVTLQTMRKDLAAEYRTEYTCPVTTGIFLRIVAEAAHEELMTGKPLNKITPFWRVIDEKSTIGKKVSFGSDFIKEQRQKEGLNKSKT